MNKTDIEWCDFTWNPVVGCSGGCFYCYAKRINDRFGMIKDFSKPEFFEKRLEEPLKKKKPSTIFVGSMCDMMDDNVIAENWLQRVLEVCQKTPQHKYMWLSKLPKNYKLFNFPSNCWLGCTVNSSIDEYRIKQLIESNAINHKFVSAEPLLGFFSVPAFMGIDLVIVGAMTGPRPTVPEESWIRSINHNNILYKENIKKYL